MNMIDMARMVPPPAPQPKRFQRLRIASALLLLLSALCVALIDVIRAIDIYLVAVVPVIMLAAITSAALYWWRRDRLEKSYWTDERYADHLAKAISGTGTKAAPKRRRAW